MKSPQKETLHSNITRQHLHSLGWSDFFKNQVSEEISAARVTGMRKNCFLVSQGTDEILATIAGSFINNPHKTYPAVGDWVLLRDTVIDTVLARKNLLSRQTAGGRNKKGEFTPVKEQPIAANLDTVFIVCGLDRDFNLRRIERYLTMVYNSGITPVIILTKADLHDIPESFADEVESVAFGVPIHLVAADDETPITALHQYLTPGHTIALVGSSGAGKSTLINRLYGKQIQTTGSVSETLGKGKHTTTNRDLIVLPSGGMIIDNPGIREVGLNSELQGSQSAFPEIEAMALECKFQDCSHSHEPGCRVLKAVADGEITQERLQSYQKLIREQDFLSQRESKGAAGAEKERWKDVALKMKGIKRNRKKR